MDHLGEEIDAGQERNDVLVQKIARLKAKYAREKNKRAATERTLHGLAKDYGKRMKQLGEHKAENELKPKTVEGAAEQTVQELKAQNEALTKVARKLHYTVEIYSEENLKLRRALGRVETKTE